MARPTFVFLVRRAQTRGIPEGARPRTIAFLASRAGISRQHFYTLMRGVVPSERIRPALALALDCSERTLSLVRRPRASTKKPRR